MIDAGLPLVQALDILSTQVESKMLARVLAQEPVEVQRAILGILAIALFVYLQFKKLIFAILGLVTNEGKMCCPRILRKFWQPQVEIDEDIPDYDEVLTMTDRKYTLAEELNCRMFGIQSMLQSSYDKLYELEEKEKGFKHLTGIHTYDILRNPSYVQ